MQIVFQNTKNGQTATVNMPPEFPDGCENDIQLRVGINLYTLKDITPKIIKTFKDNLANYVERNGDRLLKEEFCDFYSTGCIRCYAPDEFKKLFVENATKDNAEFLKDRAELMKYNVDAEMIGATFFMDWIVAKHGIEIVDIYRVLNSKDDSYPLDYLKRFQEFLKGADDTFNLRTLLRTIESTRTDYLEDTRIHCPEDFIMLPLRPLSDYVQQLSKDDEGTKPPKPLVKDPLRQETIILKDNHAFKAAIDSTIDLIQNEIDKWTAYIDLHKKDMEHRTFGSDVGSAVTLLQSFVDGIAAQTIEIDKVQKQLASMKEDDPGRPFLEAKLKAVSEPFKKTVDTFMANWGEYQKQISGLPHTTKYNYGERRYLEQVIHIMDEFHSENGTVPVAKILMQLSQYLPHIKNVAEKGCIAPPQD